MNITDGKFGSMPADYDLLTTGTTTGAWNGFFVHTDVVISGMTTWNGTVKTDTLTFAEGTTVSLGFKSITITSGTIIALKG
jgi:hypothetical protein